MKIFNNLSVRVKLASIIIATLVVMTALTLMFLQRGVNDFGERTRNQRSDDTIAVVNNSFAEMQADLLSGSKAIVSVQLIASAVSSNNSLLVGNIMSNTEGSLNIIDNLTIYGAEGDVLYLIDPTQDTAAADRTALTQLAAIGIEAVGITEVTGAAEPAIFMAVAVPVKTPDGQIVGVSLAEREITDELLNDLVFSSDVNLGLLHDNRLIAASTHDNHDHEVFSSEAHQHLGDVALSPASIQQALARRQPVVEGIRNSEAGVPYLVGYIPIWLGSDNVVIAYEIDQQTLQDFQTTTSRNLGLVIFIVGMGGAAALLLAMNTYVINRLSRLQGATAQIAQGDYSARTEPRFADEIGNLGKTFNTMAEAVQQRESQLSDLNKSLEERVKQRTQALEKATEQATEGSRLKSEFLATMSHELRTPLSGIMGFTGLLLMGVRGEITPPVREAVQEVQDSAEHLLALINDILDISKIEAGRMEIVTQRVNLPDHVKNWKARAKVLADSKGLAVKVNHDPALPTEIFGDGERLTQIATNLLGNAVKFTEQGRITLNVKKANDNQWVIQVQDTGIGIPTQAREYIFDEFRQVDGSYSRTHEGTGLGLSIVRKLAEAMGGTIHLHSKLGQGSTFTVTLPLYPVTALPEEESL